MLHDGLQGKGAVDSRSLFAFSVFTTVAKVGLCGMYVQLLFFY